MTIHCDMNCNRKCPAYIQDSIIGEDGKGEWCALVNAEVAKLDAEQRYYESMTKQSAPTTYPSKNAEGH